MVAQLLKGAVKQGGGYTTQRGAFRRYGERGS